MTTATRTWYEVRNAADRASLYVFDEIGAHGITASAFVAELNRITAKRIDVFINSPGGDPEAALAMLNALRRHPAKVTTIVDGIAASAASIIVQAGNRRVMAKQAQLMIHQASGMTLGRRQEHEQMAEMLDRIDGQLAGVYADRAGGTVEAWREKMRAETWYSAEEALAANLADEVTQFVNANAFTSGRVFALKAPTRSPTYTPPASVLTRLQEQALADIAKGLGMTTAAYLAAFFGGSRATYAAALRRATSDVADPEQTKRDLEKNFGTRK